MNYATRLSNGDVIENNSIYGKKVWEEGDVRPSWMEDDKGVARWNEQVRINKMEMACKRKKENIIVCSRCGKDTMHDTFLYTGNSEGLCNACFDDDMLFTLTGRRLIDGKEVYMGPKKKDIRIFGIKIGEIG